MLSFAHLVSQLRKRPRNVPLAATALLWVSACATGSGDTGTVTSTTDVTSTTSTVAPSAVPSSATVTGSEPLFAGKPPEVNVPDASVEQDVSDATLVTCIPSTGPGENLLIDDFEDGDEQVDVREGRSGVWYSYEESPGDHQLSFRELSGPRLESRNAIHTSGSDHGEWAGVGVTLSGCVYDASPYVGIHFWIRGESPPIYVALLTPGVIPYSQGGTCTKEDDGLCWDAYRSRLEVTQEWREVFVPFTSFSQLGYGINAGELDLTRLQAIQFQSESGAFEFWLDDLSFYVEEVYTPFDASVPPVEAGAESGEIDTPDAAPDRADAGRALRDASADAGGTL